jgi:predicted dehydrogenase
MIEKIAVVGLGSIGRRHLRLVRDLLPQTKIVVVRTRNNEKINDEKNADETYNNLEDAIAAGIEAAVISTPSTYHIDQLILLVKAGIHVLVEKPLSNSIENFDKLTDVNLRSRVIILVGYCLRYDQAAMKFKEMIAEKKAGEILHVNIDSGSFLPDWRPGQDYRQSVSANSNLGGGVLLELSHELDYSQWFFGEIDQVFAKLSISGAIDVDVEDSAEIILISNKGFVINIHLDFNSKSTRRKCNVRCTEGDLSWDAVSKTMVWLKNDGSIETSNYETDRDHIYREQLIHFIDCIENDKPPRVSLAEGIRTLHLVEAARQSNEKGQWVSIP